MARTQLWGPIAKAQLATRGITAGTGFGKTEGLRISGKIFAMLVGDELVVKLPKERLTSSSTPASRNGSTRGRAAR